MKIFFVGPVSLYMVSVFLLWPGLVDGDFTYVLTATRSNVIHQFQGQLFSGYVNFFETINGNFFLPVIIQVIIVLNILSDSLLILNRLSSKKMKYTLFFAICLFTVSPLTVGVSMFFTRDVLMGMGITSIFLYVLKNFYIEKKSFSKFEMACLSWSYFFICNIRQEGIAIFLLTFPVLFIMKAVNFKTFAQGFVFSLLSFGILLVLIPRIFSNTTLGNDHILTAVLNPIGEIVYKLPLEELDNNDFKIIQKLFPISCLKKNYSPFDIDPLHVGCINLDAKNEQLYEVLLASSRIFMSYPALYFENRINIFLNSTRLKLDSSGTIFTDHTYRVDWNTLTYKKDDEIPVQSRQLRYFKILTGLIYGSYEWIIRIFFSMLLPILGLIYILLNRNVHSFVKGCATIILLKCLLMFFLSPASYFKYYDFLYYFGFVFGILSISMHLNFTKLEQKHE